MSGCDEEAAKMGFVRLGKRVIEWICGRGA